MIPMARAVEADLEGAFNLVSRASWIPSFKAVPVMMALIREELSLC
jgi:hypothetical protein